MLLLIDLIWLNLNYVNWYVLLKWKIIYDKKCVQQDFGGGKYIKNIRVTIQNKNIKVTIQIK